MDFKDQITPLIKKEQASRKTGEPQLSDSSVNIHAGRANVVVKAIWGDNFNLSKLNEWEKVEIFLKGTENSKTANNRAISMLYLAKHAGLSPEIVTKYKKMAEHFLNVNDISLGYKQKPVLKDPLHKWTDFRKEVIQTHLFENDNFIFDDKDKSFLDLFDGYMVALYTYNPPIRPGEWLTSKFLDQDDGDTNHVNLSVPEPYVKIYHHKEKGGPRKWLLNPLLVNIMKIMNTRLYGGMKWVMPNQSNKKNSSDNFGSKLKKLLGGKTINDLRHLYASAVVSTGDIGLINYISGILGHTIQTQALHYNQTKPPPLTKSDTNKFNLLQSVMHGGDPPKPIALKKIPIKKLPQPDSNDVKCTGLNSRNKPCKFPPYKGKNYCYYHKPQ